MFNVSINVGYQREFVQRQIVCSLKHSTAPENYNNKEITDKCCYIKVRVPSTIIAWSTNLHKFPLPQAIFY